MLGEGPTDDINSSIGAAEKKISIHFSKAKAKLCLILHYNGDNSYLFVNRKKICNFKANDENTNFPCQFCLESIYDKFEYVQSEEVSLKGNVYDFPVDYDVIDKFDVLNIR